jgi:hypothetical protein
LLGWCLTPSLAIFQLYRGRKTEKLIGYFIHKFIFWY